MTSISPTFPPPTPSKKTHCEYLGMHVPSLHIILSDWLELDEGVYSLLFSLTEEIFAVGAKYHE